MKVLYTVYTRKSLEKANGQYIHPVTNKGRFATPEQAQPLANIIGNRGEYASIGKYYILTAAEYRNIPTDYKHREPDGTRAAMIEGSKLYFENLHFEIQKGEPET